MWQVIRKHLISKLLTGALVIVPLYFAFACLLLIFRAMDRFFSPLEKSLIGFSIPGLSLILLILLFYFTGWIVLGRAGKWILGGVLGFLAKLPVLSSIFLPLHLWVRAVVFDHGRIINKPVLIQFPMEGSWTIGFMISAVKISRANYFGIFIPTLPNPLTGWIIFQPEETICEPSMNYEDAVKMAISGGILSPERVF